MVMVMKSLHRLTILQDGVDEHDFDDKLPQSHLQWPFINANDRFYQNGNDDDDEEEDDADDDGGDNEVNWSGPRKDLGFHRPADACSKHHVNVPIQVIMQNYHRHHHH